MLTIHPTYNSLHRPQTFLSLPLIPMFVLLLGCLLFGAFVNILIGFLPVFHYVLYGDVLFFFVGTAGLWLLSKFDRHIFDLLVWRFDSDGRNGDKGCHRFVRNAGEGNALTFAEKCRLRETLDDALVTDTGTVMVGLHLEGKPFTTVQDAAMNALSQDFAGLLREVESPLVTVRLLHHHYQTPLTPLSGEGRSDFETAVQSGLDDSLTAHPVYANRYALLLSCESLALRHTAAIRHANGD
jgi:hypothetical protein